MRAVSLNYLDHAVAIGSYGSSSGPGAVTYPLIPVADGAGEVVALGAGVDSLAVGDRVAVHPKVSWPSGRASAAKAAPMRGVNRPGSLRELAAVSADSVVKAPAHLGWEQIATLPIAATTAWNGLVAADIGPGHTVVVLGTGGVSIFALQLAKARGARVIVTSSSDEKLARARALGADFVHNYRRDPAWDVAVREMTGGLGANLVVENAGAETFSRSLSSARHGGTVFVVGFLTGTAAQVDLLAIIGKALRVVGNNTGSTQDLADACTAIAAQRIEPAIDRTFALADLREAYGQMARGAHFGKLAVTLDWPRS